MCFWQDFDKELFLIVEEAGSPLGEPIFGDVSNLLEKSFLGIFLRVVRMSTPPIRFLANRTERGVSLQDGEITSEIRIFENLWIRSRRNGFLTLGSAGFFPPPIIIEVENGMIVGGTTLITLSCSK